MTDLEHRLRNLPLRPPADLESRALQGAAGDIPEESHGLVGWIQVAGTVAVVLVVVLLTVSVFAPPAAKNVFSNISAGLGT